jgi:hypothetical protein
MKSVIYLALIFLFSTNVYALNCLDYKNQPVAVVQDSNLNDAAVARYNPFGQSVIYYNPTVTQYFSNVMLDFVYAHECAHLVFGHGVIQQTNEQAADCWAIRRLADRGLNQNGLSQLQQEIFAFGGSGDWTHLPGGIRANNLYLCLQ